MLRVDGEVSSAEREEGEATQGARGQCGQFVWPCPRRLQRFDGSVRMGPLCLRPEAPDGRNKRQIVVRQWASEGWHSAVQC